MISFVATKTKNATLTCVRLYTGGGGGKVSSKQSDELWASQLKNATISITLARYTKCLAIFRMFLHPDSVVASIMIAVHSCQRGECLLHTRFAMHSIFCHHSDEGDIVMAI